MKRKAITLAVGLILACGIQAKPAVLTPEAYGLLDLCSASERSWREQMSKIAQPHDPAMQIEHDAMMALVDVNQATHVAIANGAWSDPQSWSAGLIPDSGARVVVPSSISIRYDLPDSPELHWLRVDGSLHFARGRDLQLRVDTIIVTPLGELEIGTSQRPIRERHQVRIIFPGQAAIDPSWDPLRLSRGLISHGRTRIHGAGKRPYARAAADLPAGSSVLSTVESPVGWQPGDQIVIPGTRHRGWMWTGSQVEWVGTDDELRIITAIDGHQISFEPALQFTHSVPEADLHFHIANLTRNIRFENSLGAATPVQQRGHIMFMHEDDVLVANAEFRHLGRTDKNLIVDDPIEQVDGTPGTGSNPRGRYSVHFHRNGAYNLRGNPSIARGLSIVGGAGWGLVNHDAHVLIEDNVAFDVFGSHFVTEIGNELGTFKRNLAILGEGSNRHFKEGVHIHDLGHSGHGFWFQGRNVIVEDNIAANVSSAAFIYFHRSSIERPYLLAENFVDHSDSAKGSLSGLAYEDVSILHNRRNQVYASTDGFHVVKEAPRQPHDLRNRISDFLAWNVLSGISMEYVNHYTLTRPRLLADQRHWNSPWSAGINVDSNVHDHIIIDSPRIRGFGPAMRDNPEFDGQPDLTRITVIDPQLIDNLPDGASATGPITHGMQFWNDDLHQIISADDLIEQPPVANLDPGPFALPTHPSWNNHLLLTGIKEDSIGAHTWSSVWHGDRLRFDILPLGHYTRSDGTRYVRLVDLIADRVTRVVTRTHFDVDIPVGYAYNIGPNLGSPPADTNQAPQAQGMLLQAARMALPSIESFQFGGISLLDNDMDPDGDAIHVRITETTLPEHGQVSVNANGTLLYVPPSDFVGVDRFHYQISDGTLSSALVEVEILVFLDRIFEHGMD